MSSETQTAGETAESTVEVGVSRVGLGLTAVMGILTAAATLLAGGGVALLGVAIAVGGVYRASRVLLGVGVVCLFVAVFAATMGSVSVGFVAVAMAGTLLTWDVGENAISVAEQLRARAETERIEVVHAASSALVAAFFATGGYIVYLVSTGGQPAVALGLLVVGAIVAILALQK